MFVLIVIGVVLFILILMVIGIFNKLVTLRNRFKNSFSQIDVQLKRRYDLIPNLVESAKAYMGHERQTLEAVISARNSAVSANQKAAANPTDAAAMQGMMSAETLLSGSVGKFFALAEQYPNLKANETIASLMEELTTTENKISFSRQAYNDSVMDYNNNCQVFPNTIFAGMFGFKEAVLFEVAAAAEREAVKVKF